MSDETKRAATYDDLLELPEHVVGEIVDGELHVSPRPPLRAAFAKMGTLVDVHPTPGWWTLFEPELHLGPDVLVPDIAGWRRDRLPRLPDTEAMEVPPDWVCEIASPSTARFDRLKKPPAYARYGVAHLWLIDPGQRWLEVYRLGDAGLWVRVATYADEDPIFRAEPFEAVEIDIRRWWPDEDEPTSP